MEVLVCQQRLWQFTQEHLEQGGHIIGMKIPRVQVYICTAVQSIL